MPFQLFDKNSGFRQYVRGNLQVGEQSTTSVADPHLFDVDSDPPFHIDADPNPSCHFHADPDPTFCFDAEPDPSF
jgi:hypothetical protein